METVDNNMLDVPQEVENEKEMPANDANLVEETEKETQQIATKEERVDYMSLTKEELVDALAGLLEKPLDDIKDEVAAIKHAFYSIRKTELEAEKAAFVERGNEESAFAPMYDESENRLKELLAKYKELRAAQLEAQEAAMQENLNKKRAIIEELGKIVDDPDNINKQYQRFQQLQQDFKTIGAVPPADDKALWKEFQAATEKFYDLWKINKELRDYDFKKNLEIKQGLCEDAEALAEEKDVIAAFKKLQLLHDKWRETGPVANEFKEQLWERFREASTKINKRHQEYFNGIKEEQKHNLELKTELCVKTEELSAAPLSTRKEWNKASEQLIDIQKVWKTVGFAPKKDNTKIYERFRNACDKFFENKRNFYLQIKAEMENNLHLKNDICAAAEALQESEEWKKATDELIALQKRWKEIGPVSRRYSDAIWKRFRSACDKFFERKAAFFASLDQQYEENLAKKKELLEELKAFVVENKERGFEALKELQHRWAEIGFVPIKQKEAIQKEYRKAVDAIFAKLRSSDKENRLERFKGKISSIAEGGDRRRLRFERDRLYNKMKQLESDIALLENNIGFFSKSKNAEAMIREVNNKIAKAKEEMATLVEKIDMIDKQNNQAE